MINRNRIIELHKKTIDDKNKLKIQADIYKNKIDNYKWEISKEFSIEEILENYKLQFEKDFQLNRIKKILILINNIDLIVITKN